jgi:hypothetical protein
MRALPEPEAGGSVDEVRNFVPFQDDDDYILYVAFGIGCYQGGGI